MGRKDFWRFVLAGGCLLAQLSMAQMTKPVSINLDSIMTLTANGLASDNIEQSEQRINSLLFLISDKKPELNLLNQLKIKSLQGRFLFQAKKLNEWEDLYTWANNKEALCKTDEELTLIVKLFNNAGIAFKRLALREESEEAFLKSCDALRKLSTPDYVLNGSVYINAGNSLKQSGEYDRSIEYLTQGIKYLDDFVGHSTATDPERIIKDLKTVALDNLGLAYQAKSDHKEAITVFKSCIDILLKYKISQDIYRVYGNLVISLIELGNEAGNLNEAKDIISQILKSYSSGTPPDRQWALAMLNQIDINFRIDHDTRHYLKELELLCEKIRQDIPVAMDITVIANQLSANQLIEQEKYGPALIKWSEAISSIDTSGQIFSPAEIPYHVHTKQFDKLIELVNLNAKIFVSWGNKTMDIEKLKQAEERYGLSLKLIDSLRNLLEYQSSKLLVSRMQRSSYDQKIELEYLLFQRTGDSTFLDRLFTTMEQSKSAVLLSSVRDIGFKSNVIPQEELDKERTLKEQLAGIQGRILQLSANPGADQQDTKDLQEKSDLYNQQLSRLILKFKQEYPDYYIAKFDRSTLSPDQVANHLNNKQILIEYAISFKNLYTITISTSGKSAGKVPISQKTDEDIVFLLDFMKGHMESLTSSARARYCEAATGLYQLLIGPSASLVEGKELIFIPDGTLSYLPFEALLAPQSPGTKIDYRKLPYLIRKHSISYGLTATVFFYKPQRIPNPSRKVLAIAPTYDLTNGNISDFIRKAQSGLPELSGTFQESKAIKRMIGGRFLSGKRATEATFKKIGSAYSILHLAMHTIPDRSNSLNSSLVFTPGADKKEDGVLFGHEVYNLSLNAWLTVLSACETGTGDLAGGEGILSFARAFVVAGCPNLIMTMWTVDDRSSKDIMIGFYKSLLSGCGIANALRTSKLAYLERVDQMHAHPHFWAGFVELGQNQVLKIPRNWTGLIGLVIVFSMTILLLVYLQIKKNPRRSRDMLKSKIQKL